MNDVVRGEASESEDEASSLTLEQKRILAAEVTGEASEESDEVENNLSIWRSLNLFVKNICTAASKQLLTTDQLLIKSQTSMQSVLVTLNQAQLNVKQLYEKTEAVFTTNFIPNINVQANKT